MITATQFIETHRDTSCRADCLDSLAQAAQLILEGGALLDPKKRMAIAFDMLEVIKFLSQNLSQVTGQLSDEAERAEWSERRSPQPSCGCSLLNPGGGAA